MVNNKKMKQNIKKLSKKNIIIATSIFIAVLIIALSVFFISTTNHSPRGCTVVDLGKSKSPISGKTMICFD